MIDTLKTELARLRSQFYNGGTRKTEARHITEVLLRMARDLEDTNDSREFIADVQAFQHHGLNLPYTPSDEH